ncbi:YfiR family protein [Maricurvus nonylphenolicus]|uniref:YfiR family protein n=1 Tax=Maricurvus nonylphenolicus TaxID=1008307 RepID=UPI0036F2EC9F
MTLVMLLGVASASAYSQDVDQKQRLVKAAFILNIAKFVTWPEASYQTRPKQLVLCHYRQDVLEEAYEIIRRRKVGARQLQAKLIDDMAAASQCDMILVAKEEMASLLDDSASLSSDPVLVIADMTDQEGQGVAYKHVSVALVRRGSRIGFEINLQEAKRLGLVLSSELLKLAQIVE